MKKAFIMISTVGVPLLISLLIVPRVEASEWVSPNLVTNGDFSYRGDGWKTYDWAFNGFTAACSYNGTSGGHRGIHQRVGIEPYKRYRISGKSYAYGHSQTRVEALGWFATDWWGPGWSQVLTQKTAEGIIGNSIADGVQNAIYFMLTYNNLNPGVGGDVLGVFDNVGLYQVVYDPDISISQNEIRVNSDLPNGISAAVSLTLNDHTDYADALTSQSMNWGDGETDNSIALNSSYSHRYSIENNNDRYQTWNAILSGTNQAGTDMDISVITILRQPLIDLKVNSISVSDGETIEVDILNDPILDLSLLDSLGYTEGASLVIDGLLNQTGVGVWNFSYSGSLFDESDIGTIYPLSAGGEKH